jgi:hypothetical protein
MNCFVFSSCLDMENTSKDGDRGKQLTKASASSRRAKAAENPSKKQSRKPPT